jgi:hypothetical protein
MVTVATYCFPLPGLLTVNETADGLPPGTIPPAPGVIVGLIVRAELLPTWALPDPAPLALK